MLTLKSHERCILKIYPLPHNITTAQHHYHTISPITLVLSFDLSLDMASSSTTRSDYPRFSSQTLELRAQIAKSISTLPLAHLKRPIEGEVFTTPEEAKTRVLNWGFSQGYALICSSANNVRGRWETILYPSLSLLNRDSL